MAIDRGRPAGPTPERIIELMNGYQRTELLRAAIELGVFTAAGAGGDGGARAAEIAKRCEISERGARILCDALAVQGLLEKSEGRYRLADDAAAFLDESSPSYLGGTIEFMLAGDLIAHFRDLAAAARRGGTTCERGGTTAVENPLWVTFARVMAPLMDLPARLVAAQVEPDPSRPVRVLDIAAGHGLFGLRLAERHPNVEVVALDWPGVLEVTRENAARMGLAGRLETIAGNAFEADLGSGYDHVLLPNFLHHFGLDSCEAFLRRVRGALRDGGSALTVEFIPDEGRVSPPAAARFALVMLATTPSGDAYTFAEYEALFRRAGFASSELREIPPSTQRLIISRA